MFFVAKQLNTPSTPIVQVRTAGSNPNDTLVSLSGSTLSGTLDDPVVAQVPNRPVANMI